MSYLAICIPIVMYSLGLFIVVLQDYITISCCVSELHGHLYPYHGVEPGAVYC